jgi:hypothetical protein
MIKATIVTIVSLLGIVISSEMAGAAGGFLFIVALFFYSKLDGIHMELKKQNEPRQ